jgi:chromosome segregation ATPase
MECKGGPMRVRHLVHYLHDSLGNIMYDQIAHQMDKHQISAHYETSRVLEIFQSLLITEREELITELGLSYQSTKQQKRSLWHAIKHQRQQSEEEIVPLSQQHLEYRRRLTRLRSRADTSHWKLGQLSHAQGYRTESVKSQISTASPLLTQTKRELESITADLNSMKETLSSKSFAQISSQVKCFWKDYVFKLRQFAPLDELRLEFGKQQQITMRLRQSLASLREFAGDAGPSTQFQIQLRRRIASARQPTFVTNGQQITTRVTQMVEQKTNEYTERLRRQQLIMERLKAELERAERRLQALANHGNFRKTPAIDELEKSHAVLKKRQARTDEVMRQLFGDDHSTQSFTDGFSMSPIRPR